MACVRPAREEAGSGFWSAFAAPSETEWRAAQARRMQQNTGTQLLEKILHERKKANGAVKRERGLAYGGCWKVRSERPPPGRLAAPETGGGLNNFLGGG